MGALAQTLATTLLLTAVCDFGIYASAVKEIPSGWRKLQVPQTSRVSIGGQEFYLAGLKVFATSWAVILNKI